MKLIDRGGSAADTSYSYYPVSGSFRLQTIQHGTGSDALPDFSYLYDAVGNVT